MLQRKYRIHAFLAVMALVIIFYPSYVKKPDRQHIDAANAAAENFLTLVDNGQFEQSWHVCAQFLQNDIPLSQWVAQLQAVRATAGTLIERRQVDMVSTKGGKKGIPEGDYIIYTYNSTFSNQDNISETVTLMLEQDAVWRVAGYFID